MSDSLQSQTQQNGETTKVEAPKQEPTKIDSAEDGWNLEKAKAIKSKYKDSPDEIAKALFHQQTENAKYRKELEAFKASAPKKESSVSAQEKESAPVHKDSLLKRALQDLRDNDNISEELAAEIKKANNFTDDAEYNVWASAAKNIHEQKFKDAQNVVKMPVKDILKKAASVCTDAELVSLQVSLEAGVYDVLRHVERKINSSSKEKTIVQHGNVGASNPTGEKGWSSMEEWSDAAKSPNMGLDSYNKMMSEKNKNTDWSKLRSTMSMGSVRPTFNKPKQ